MRQVCGLGEREQVAGVVAVRGLPVAFAVAVAEACGVQR